jgi:hypothetical protein
MPLTTRTIIAIAVAVVSTVRLIGQSGPDKAMPDLTGAWVLNNELSDKPVQMRGPDDVGGEGGRGRPPGGPGGGGGFGGGMGGLGRGGSGNPGGAAGMPNPEEMERMRAVMEVAMRVPAKLIIVKSDERLVVTDDEGVSVRVPLDGKKDTGAANGVPFETRAKWERSKLRVERKFKGGLKIVEYYSVSIDPRILTVTSKLEGGQMPGGARTVKRVYDLKPS